MTNGEGTNRPVASNTENRVAFLYSIIDDTQGTIRSTDSKAAFGIAVLSAILAKVLAKNLELHHLAGQPLVVIIVLGLFWLFATLAAILAFRVLFPTINPYRNVRVPTTLAPRFFITELSDKSWLRLFSSSDRYSTLSETHDQYHDSIVRATPEDLVSVLCAEVLKLSFIRQLKTDRLIWFAYALVTSVVFFLAFEFVSGLQL
jgi:hypothetical protein